MHPLLPPTPRVRLVIAGGETLFDYRGYRAAREARGRRTGRRAAGPRTVADQQLATLVAPPTPSPSPLPKKASARRHGRRWAAASTRRTRLPVLREVFGRTARLRTPPEALAAAPRPSITRPRPRRQAAGRALAARHTGPKPPSATWLLPLPAEHRRVRSARVGQAEFRGLPRQFLPPGQPQSYDRAWPGGAAHLEPARRGTRPPR